MRATSIQRFTGLDLKSALLAALIALKVAPALAFITEDTVTVGNFTGGSKNTTVLQVANAAPIPIPEAIDLTAKPDDLWVRIRHGFSMPDLDNDLVRVHQEYYLRKPANLLRMAERGRPYLYFIVKEIERRGMPMEFALLPMVESAYNPLAQSPAKAVGLWQFIPSTGKIFMLQQDWWHDQRRDFIESTRSALDYLQFVYEMHGDWHLALASYNWGEYSVARAVKKNRNEGLPEDFNAIKMPDETRNYVPKLQALKNIVADKNLFSQLGLPPIPNKPYFMTLTSEKNLDLNLAAKLAHMDTSSFVNLNAAHKRPLIRAGDTIVLPADRLELFQNNLSTYKGNLSSWRIYKPETGEQLDKLAEKLGIDYNLLSRINGLNKRISAGHSILLPKRRISMAKIEAAINELPPALTLSPQAESKTTNKKSTRKGVKRRYSKSSSRVQKKKAKKRRRIASKRSSRLNKRIRRASSRR